MIVMMYNNYIYNYNDNANLLQSKRLLAGQHIPNQKVPKPS